MNMSPGGVEAPNFDPSEIDEKIDDLDDEETIQTDRGVRLGLKSIESDNNAENRDSNVARFALAESGEGEDEEATMDSELKSASASMELALVQDAMNVMKLKVEAGRDPNELHDMVLEELQSVREEIDSLLEEGGQETMLKDAEMRESKLVAQMRYLQNELEKVQ